jgi:hypothetical protein
MRKFMLGFVLAASLVSAAPLFALKLDGTPIIIPVIGRFPGAGGTQWRTDVFVHNAFEPGQVVALRFYPSGGAMIERTVPVAQYSSVKLNDIVLNTFGLTNAGGVLEIHAVRVLARATIYNSGNPAGRFGQGVPGIPAADLSRQAMLYGLSGNDGSRVNIGVANPNDVPVPVNILINDGITSTNLYLLTATVPAHGYVQYGDIFNAYHLPPDALLIVEIRAAELPIYGFSSEVRNDTGDAIFNFGTNPNA